MGGLTLPRLHGAIPTLISSPEAHRLAMGLLRERCDVGLPVFGLSAKTPAEVLRRTIRAATRVRGPLADGSFDVLVAVEPERHHGEESEFCSSSASIAIYCKDERPAFRYIGKAIQRLEDSHRGLGETVLSAIALAEVALPGVVSASALESFMGMLRWSELDSSFADEDAKRILIDEGGYTEDSLPMLPSEFRKAVGGEMWLKPKSRLNAARLKAALSPFGEVLAIELTAIVKRHLPKVCRQIRAFNSNYSVFQGYYHCQLCIIPDDAGEGEFLGLFDDVYNDRMNSGEDSALLRCPPYEACRTTPPPRNRRSKKEPAPITFDGLATVAEVLRGYHLLHRLLHLLELIENQP